jgi:ABC-type lipoprotein export system ATPase subunit
MSVVPGYPVRVGGRLDPQLSRWLWLVKWLLAIPHYVVLVFLWLAFILLTVVAFFAIVFTGRYPRGIFDFNAGVLRWTWRVAFYSYSALATDRYPPFSLGEEADYPATLEIPYPEHLSRGLALVKWWLLALPHYLVVGIFAGGGWVAWQSDHGRFAGGGLVSLLVLLAAVALLFTGRYPHGIFDLVLGLNRWVLRVAAYAALMTDAYPPFRLDMGEGDGGVAAIPQAPARTTGGPGRVVLIVLGSIFGLIALGLLAGGGTAVVYDQTQRGSDGFVTSSFHGYATGTYAIVSDKIELNGLGPDSVWSTLLGTVRVWSRSDHAAFIGVGRSDDVDAYVGAVRREQAGDFVGNQNLQLHGGGAPATAPAAQTFWVASASGSGEQSLTWDAKDGTWTGVLMNTDGSSGVDASVAVGAELPKPSLDRPRDSRRGGRRRRARPAPDPHRSEEASVVIAPPIVEARAVSKTYDTGKVQVNALNGVNLSLEPGEMVAIMGPSGCGKTTLLNCLSGLDAIDAGEIVIEGVPLAAMSDRERTDYRARRMGFVFQFYNLMPVLTAVENVELPLLVARVPAAEARRRALDALALVGLEDRARHVPDALSGGERQRVTIARSLVNDPAIVWADEPTGDLDSENAVEIVELMRRLNLERGLTFLIVTHDIAVGKATDRIVRMLDGRVVEELRMEVPHVLASHAA